ncbi:hypothetical protein BJX62DRAFT_243824 [Aspergillus germanicus]
MESDIRWWWANDANGVARLQQTIVISKNPATNTITITGAPLLLEFDKLFERQPATPTERDIEIGNDQLEW